MFFGNLSVLQKSLAEPQGIPENRTDSFKLLYIKPFKTSFKVPSPPKATTNREPDFIASSVSRIASPGANVNFISNGILLAWQ